MLIQAVLFIRFNSSKQIYFRNFLWKYILAMFFLSVQNADGGASSTEANNEKTGKMKPRFHFQADTVCFSLSCLQNFINMIFGFFKKVQMILIKFFTMMMCIRGIQGWRLKSDISPWRKNKNKHLSERENLLWDVKN